jgi:hypothetical protein
MDQLLRDQQDADGGLGVSNCGVFVGEEEAGKQPTEKRRRMSWYGTRRVESGWLLLLKLQK